MDLSRYLDLYLSETQEHLRTLNRALLDLETDGGTGAVAEAFRAVHTIKGMSAAMGHRVVAEVAHVLEDLLAEVRSGKRPLSSDLIDDLLARADRLERSVLDAVGGVQAPAEERPQPAAAPAAPAAPAVAKAPPTALAAPPAQPSGVPEGTEQVARVALKASTALKAARAMILLRIAGKAAPILGSSPTEFGDDFDGVLRLFVGAGADRAALESAITGAGDVESVVIEPVGALAPAAPPLEPAPARPAERGAAAAKVRHVRVDQRRLDDLADGVGELSILHGRVAQLIGESGSEVLTALADRMGGLVAGLRESVLAVRLVPVGEVFDRFPRVVRDAARQLGKEVEFRVEGRDIQLDRSILEEIADPLVHLLRNSVDHGIEGPDERVAAGKPMRARLLLRALRQRSSVVIQVEDDGRGVDKRRVAEKARASGVLAPSASDMTDEALLKVLSHAGFSTAAQVTDLSGRGVGLDAVVSRVRALGGAIDLRTVQGEGTTFTLRLPITLAVADALRARIGGEDYAIPLTHVAEAVELEEGSIAHMRGREILRLRGELVPLVRLRAVLGAVGEGREMAAVVTEVGERRTALAVDELVGKEQIVVREFDAAAGMLPCFSGVTLLADGRPALVLDPVSVL